MEPNGNSHVSTGKSPVAFNFKVIPEDWDSKLQQTMVEMFPLRSADAAYGKINAMLSTLGDPFTRIISPKEFQSFRIGSDGNLQGVGLFINSEPRTGHLVVMSCIEGSPHLKPWTIIYGAKSKTLITVSPFLSHTALFCLSLTRFASLLMKTGEHKTSRRNYNATRAYALSKLANVLHTIELSRILHEAATTCYVAASPRLRNVCGKYFSDCNEARTSKSGSCNLKAQTLWTASEFLVTPASTPNVRSSLATSEVALQRPNSV
ncbi:unnamed protein product [Brassica oleracea var. botrytis]|uniref:(rape) hypothetical protein n=1 Tax=Brassica napus TaxID=3708 RepID=A0A816Q7P3_BRANA|nr:unnamed protein product [Brassica napus]